MLYFFYGGTAVVLTHGLTKERDVSDREIERAIGPNRKFEADPDAQAFLKEV